MRVTSSERKAGKPSVNIFHSSARESDAKKLADRLMGCDALVNLIDIHEDEASRSFSGKLYFFCAGQAEFHKAQSLTEAVRDIEVITPQFCELKEVPIITYSIWLTGGDNRNQSSTKLQTHQPYDGSQKAQHKQKRSKPNNTIKRYLGGGTNESNTHVASLSPSYGSFRLCVCEGSNENCRYCYGTGRITEKFSAQQGPTAVLYSSRRISKGARAKRNSYKSNDTPRNIVTLPEVTLPPLRKDPNVEKAVKNQPRSFQTESTGRNRDLEREGWKLCSKCQVYVKKERIDAHTIEHEKGSARQSTYSASVTSPFNTIRGIEKIKRQQAKSHQTTQNGLIPCSVCSALVRPDRLKKHLRKVHRLRAPLKSMRNNRTVSSESSTNSKVVFDSQYEDPRAVRQIDHTRLYAHAFREGGRYGSHPSHDGFDDESKP